MNASSPNSTFWTNSYLVNLISFSFKFMKSRLLYPVNKCGQSFFMSFILRSWRSLFLNSMEKVIKSFKVLSWEYMLTPLTFALWNMSVILVLSVITRILSTKSSKNIIASVGCPSNSLLGSSFLLSLFTDFTYWWLSPFDWLLSLNTDYKLEIKPSLALSSSFCDNLLSNDTYSFTMFSKLFNELSSSLRRNSVFVESWALGFCLDAIKNLTDLKIVFSQSSSTVSFLRKASKLIFILTRIIWYFVKILRMTAISYSLRIYSSHNQWFFRYLLNVFWNSTCKLTT